MKKLNTDIDMDKFNECIFASLFNEEAREIVDKYIELSAGFVITHGYNPSINKVLDSIVDNHGDLPIKPFESEYWKTEILAQFMDDMHNQLSKRGIL